MHVALYPTLLYSQHFLFLKKTITFNILSLRSWQDLDSEVGVNLFFFQCFVRSWKKCFESFIRSWKISIVFLNVLLGCKKGLNNFFLNGRTLCKCKMSLSSILAVSGIIFRIRWHSSAIFSRVIIGSIFYLANIIDLISASMFAGKPCTNIGRLNKSNIVSFN